MKKIIITALAISFISCKGLYAQMPIQGPGPVVLPQNQQTPPPAPNPPSIPLGPGPVMPPPPNPQTPPGWSNRGFLTNPPTSDWMNQGYLNVIATGYNSQGVLQQIPLYVSYSFNGVSYNVMVVNAWNPYTQNWNVAVDIPANQTDYYLNGFSYNYFAALPIGNFYFNL